jgi:uncharacterized ubiquitin-like protein YukD
MDSDYVFITLVKESKSIDLKVPSFIPVKELIDLFSEALNFHLGNQTKIQAEPLGRILDNDKSIAEQKITQGSILTLI